MSRTRFAISLCVLAFTSMAGGFLAVALLFDTTPAEAGPGTIGAVRASAFELVDDTGSVRAKMDVSETGAVRFSMLDEKGKGRIQIAADSTKSSIALMDAQGTPRYLVAQTESDDRVKVIFSDRTGAERHLSALTKAGDCLLAFTGPKDEKWVTLLAGPEQASTLILQDPKSGQNLVQFAGRGQASIQIGDKKSVGGFLASVLGDGRSVLALSKDGKLRVRGMTKEDGKPELLFFDPARKPVWRAGE